MKFGLIGFPVAHSQSPRLFAEAFGLSPEQVKDPAGEYSYTLIEEDSFDAAWQRFLDGGFDGINVTAPFKTDAARAVADSNGVLEPEVVETGATNFVVRENGRLHAFNTDALAVLQILEGLLDEDTSVASVTVVGLGGAGRAALWAARQLAARRPLNVAAYHHDELGAGIAADVVVYTLPSPAPGTEGIRARYLLEAGYLNPCCSALPGVGRYLSGLLWLRTQATLCWSRFLQHGK